MKKSIPLILVINFVFILTSIVWYSFAEEKITLTTYYPAPYGDYLRLSTNSMSVGNAYRTQTLTDGVLIVNNSVGVGTSSPDSQAGLHIKDRAIFLEGNTPFIKIRDTDATDNAGQFKFDIDGTSLRIIDEDQSSTRMVIDASGRLGIGMEDPQSNLHINTGGQLQIGRTTDSMYVNLTTNDLKFNRTDTGTWSYISQYGSGKGLAFTTSGGSSNTRMVIDGNGKVGIGTATPWEKLTIQGTDEPLNIHAGGSQAILSNAYWDSGQRRWEYSQSQRKASVISFSGGGVSIQGAEEGTKDNLVTWNNGINVVSSGNVGIGTTSPTGKFEVSTDGSSHDLVVTSTGNVGIGYQNPQVELDVNGDIYVENRPIFRLSRTDCGNAESCTNWCSIIHPYVIAGGCSNSSNNYQTLKESKPIEDGTGKQGWYCHYNAKSWPDTWALCTSISVNSDDL